MNVYKKEMSFLLFLGVIFLLSQEIHIATVKQESMMPAYYPNDHVVIREHFTHSIQRKDVIILRDPLKEHDSKRQLIKRVYGLPGDHIEIQNGNLYINKKEIEHHRFSKKEIEDIYLSKREYYVLGDNRLNSRDSRIFGPVEQNEIIGEVIYHY